MALFFMQLFLSYVENQFFPNDADMDHNALVHFGILTGITLLLAFVNYRGLDFVGKTLVLIFIVTVTPFVLLVIIGLPKGKYMFLRIARY